MNANVGQALRDPLGTPVSEREIVLRRAPFIAITLDHDFGSGELSKDRAEEGRVFLQGGELKGREVGLIVDEIDVRQPVEGGVCGRA